MRIIGSIPHPVFKITIFKMDNRLSIKIEDDLYEQIYKFRTDDGMEKAEDVQKIADEAFLKQAERIFKEMHAAKLEAFERNRPKQNLMDEFPVIL